MSGRGARDARACSRPRQRNHGRPGCRPGPRRGHRRVARAAAGPWDVEVGQLGRRSHHGPAQGPGAGRRAVEHPVRCEMGDVPSRCHPRHGRIDVLAALHQPPGDADPAENAEEADAEVKRCRQRGHLAHHEAAEDRDEGQPEAAELRLLHGLGLVLLQGRLAAHGAPEAVVLDVGGAGEKIPEKLQELPLPDGHKEVDEQSHQSGCNNSMAEDVADVPIAGNPLRHQGVVGEKTPHADGASEGRERHLQDGGAPEHVAKEGVLQEPHGPALPGRHGKLPEQAQHGHGQAAAADALTDREVERPAGKPRLRALLLVGILPEAAACRDMYVHLHQDEACSSQPAECDLSIHRPCKRTA
mmetsp:Transcript_23093/g.72030  ORF Transcript_23093/g.72030 Transcript_23093/m.72030 type:complete len:357 (-) Transcript_23093:54-1124(-)